jgi:predicted lactoylglutathione lyase
MPRMIFPNLPVQDVDRAIAFFSALGFSFNSQFTDHNAACMVVNDLASVMLLKREFYATFTNRQIIDTSTHSGCILAIEVGSREEVDAMMEKALASGATEANPPKDYGFMYQRSFHDPDGNHWEPFHMDPSYVQPA